MHSARVESRRTWTHRMKRRCACTQWVRTGGVAAHRAHCSRRMALGPPLGWGWRRGIIVNRDWRGVDDDRLSCVRQPAPVPDTTSHAPDSNAAALLVEFDNLLKVNCQQPRNSSDPDMHHQTICTVTASRACARGGTALQTVSNFAATDGSTLCSR